MATIPNNYRILKYTALQGQDQFIIDWPYDDKEDVYFRINDSLDVKLSGNYEIIGGMLGLFDPLNAGDKVVIYRNKQAEQALEFITGGAVTQKMLQENNNDIFFILQDILKNYLNLTDREQIVDFVNNVILPLLPDASETVRGLIKIATDTDTLGLTDNTKALTAAKLKVFYDNYSATTDRKGFVRLSWSGEIADFNNNTITTSDRVITSNLLKAFYLNYSASASRKGFIRLANDEEAIEGLNLEKAITPYTLKKVLDNAGIGGGDGSQGGKYDSKRRSVNTFSGLNPSRVGNKLILSGGAGFIVDVKESVNPINDAENDYLTDNMIHEVVVFNSPSIEVDITNYNAYVNLYLKVNYDKENEEEPLTYEILQVLSGDTIPSDIVFNTVYLGYAFIGDAGSNSISYFNRKDYFFDLDKRTVRSFDYNRRIKDLVLEHNTEDSFLGFKTLKDFTIFGKNANAIENNEYRTNPNHDFKLHLKSNFVTFYTAYWNGTRLATTGSFSNVLPQSFYGYINNSNGTFTNHTNNHKYTNLRVFINSFGNFLIQQGQTAYDSLNDAINAIENEQYLYNLGSREWEWVYTITIRTDISDATLFEHKNNIQFTRVIDGIPQGISSGGAVVGGTDIEKLPVGTIMILNPDNVAGSDKWLDCNGEVFDDNLYPDLSLLTGYQSTTQINSVDYDLSIANTGADGAVLLRKDNNCYVYKNRIEGFKTKVAVNYNTAGTSSSFYTINTTLGVSLENMNYPDLYTGITNTLLGRNSFDTTRITRQNAIFNCDIDLKPGVFMLVSYSSTGYTGLTYLFDIFNQTNIQITGIEGQAVERHFNPTINKFVITTRNYTGGIYYMNIYTLGVNDTAATLVYQTTNNQFMMTPFTGNRASGLQGSTASGTNQYNYNLNTSNYINGGNNYLDGKYYFFDLFNRDIFYIDENTWSKTIVYNNNGNVYQWLTSDEGVNITNGICNGYSGRQASIAYGLGQGSINSKGEFIFIDAYSLQNKTLTVRKTKDFIVFQEIFLDQFSGISFNESTSQFRNVCLIDDLSEISGFIVMRPSDFEPTSKQAVVYWTFAPSMDPMVEWYDVRTWGTIGTLIEDKIILQGLGGSYGTHYTASVSQAGTNTPYFYPDDDGKYKYYLKAKI